MIVKNSNCIYVDTIYAKNSLAVKKGEAKNAQVHVHGVTTTKRHDIKIWPRKHLQYRHFYTFVFYIYASHYHIQLAVHVCLQYKQYY